VAVLALGASASAGLPKYRIHLPPGESQSTYENACSKIPHLRTLLAVVRFGKKWPPVGRIFCYLAPYTASAKTGWAFIDVQAGWHVPNGINGRMASLGFPAAIFAVGPHTVEFRIDACYESPCKGANVWKQSTS
jgi:hypothetical protein